MIEALRTLVEAGSGPATVLEAVYEQTGLLSELQASSDPQDETRVENLRELEAVAREYEEANPDGTLGDFLEQVVARRRRRRHPRRRRARRRRHADDACTPPRAWSSRSSSSPGSRTASSRTCAPSATSKELEEERRLAYVGITRARQRLYISRALVRSAFGQPSWNPASRFLDEVPEELLAWERAEPKSGSRGTSAPSLAHVAARPSAKSPGNREVVHLAPGDRVTHDTFGLGTVVSTAGAAEKAEATIDFGDYGVKRLLLRYAPVDKL